MARFDKDPFPGTDYSAYQSWEKVTTPDGETYYVVPGHSGYVLDITASNATGRKVFRKNPSNALKQQEQEKANQDKLIAQQQFNQSPAGQLIPVAASTGGLIAASQFMPGASAGSDVVKALADAGALGATQGTGGAGISTPQIVSATSIPTEPTSISNFAGSATPYLGAAGAGLGAYQAYQGIKGGNPVQAGLGGLGAGLGINAMGYALGPWGWAAMAGAPVVASLLGGDVFGGKSTKEIQADRWKNTNANPEIVAAMAGGHDYFAGTGGEKSRDERFLTPDAIRNNPDNYNNIPDWEKWSKSQQDQFLSTMLNEGKVQEKKGGIYYDDDRAKELADEIRNKKPAIKPMERGGGVGYRR